MVRPEKSGTNQLCVEIGNDRKHALKEYANKHHKTITDILIDHIDSLLEEQKKAKA
jgi:hypothetical protein